MSKDHNGPPSARPRGSGDVTIHDVAAQAGVSVATVSRVLNGKQVVREQTSRRVLEAAKAMHYVPNVAARTLINRRSQTIGILLPDLHGEFFSEVIRGIDVAARNSGYHILVSGWHSAMGEMLEMVDTMRGRVDGLLVMAPDLTAAELRERLTTELPLVLLNSADDGHNAVTIDNYGGARAMTRHLADLGHVRIAFIKGPPQNGDARERLRGYREVMRSLAGGGRSGDLELAGNFSEESGYDAARKVIGARSRPTAIFAANDAMAIGAQSALADAGLDVPGDMAVVGFDDIPIAHYVAPALTTVRVDISDLGRRGLRLLLDVIAGPQAQTARRECVPTSLVIRKSCGSKQSPHKPGTSPSPRLRSRSKGEKS